jgi:hypothetical protein
MLQLSVGTSSVRRDEADRPSLAVRSTASRARRSATDRAGTIDNLAESGQKQAYRQVAVSGHPLPGLCHEAIAFRRNPCVASMFQAQPQPPIFLQTLTASVFSLRWLRTESRQSPIRFKPVAMCCDRPGGIGRPRETLVPSRVQGVSHIPVAVARATPVRNGLSAWAIQSSALQSGGTKTASNHSRWLYTRPLSWLTAFGQAITRNSAAHRRASARAACDSTPARVCARSP